MFLGVLELHVLLISVLCCIVLYCIMMIRLDVSVVAPIYIR